MSDLMVSKKVLPTIEFNKEELKKYVEEATNKYKTLVVTEETLKDCVSTSKELASLRVKLDNARKTVKKDLSAPITAFESDMKELISMVKDIEEPIKIGIDSFETKRKDAKRAEIIEQFNELAADLSDKYKSKFIVEEKTLNKTATKESVTISIESQLMVLRQAQDKEKTDIAFIESTLEDCNAKLTAKLSPSLYMSMLTETNVIEVVSKIKSDAKRFEDAEIAVKAQVAKEEPKVEIVEYPQNAPASMTELVRDVTVKFSVTAPRQKLEELKKYMADNNINWTQA